MDIAIYKIFLKKIEQKISSNDFSNSLNKVIEVDQKHFDKEIKIEKLKKILTEYEKKDLKNLNKTVQILLLGNPEIIFRLGIEAFVNNISIIISIDDFCLGQNMLLTELFNQIYKELKLKINLKLENLNSITKIEENNSTSYKTICIGDSNKYNLLCRKIKDLIFYPYNIFELYSDSDEFDEIKRKIYDHAILNGFEIEIYDMDLEFNDIVDVMNQDGYGFCSILLSKDSEKIKYFKNNIKAQYIVVNENPFRKTEFKLEI